MLGIAAIFRAFVSGETGPDLDYVDFLNKRTLRTPVSDVLQLWRTVDLLPRLWPGNSLQLLFSRLRDGMRCPRGQLILEVSKIPEFFRNASPGCHRMAPGMVGLLCKVEGSLTG